METVGKAVDPELKARIEREREAVYSSARLWVSILRFVDLILRNDILTDTS